MPLHLLGIRHHGPGSSRHVLAALERIQPDIILIEGPPEGEAMLRWVNHADMKPPVALLAYVPDNPKRAVFYPFTSFSPEWNAILYGLEHKIPIRFIDMPLAHSLANSGQEEDEDEVLPAEDPSVLQDNSAEEETKLAGYTPAAVRRNPISYLADIAGFDDAEEWWEQQFEIARHPAGVFEAITASMTALRDHIPQRSGRREAIREAFMRRGIRTAQREMYMEIAVVCGAWHVPALATMPKQKDDDSLLKNLPKTKVETTWIPWTNDRLSFESGYGAGLESPGWYRHNWQYPDDNGAIWLAHTARIFRQNNVDISSAHVIEAVRLANSLAGLRNLGRPGLREYTEATQAVMCMGDEVVLQIIRRELIVGKELGAVPEGTPQAPIQRDLELLAKKLRLKISDEAKLQKLDLREENDLQKSVLLHRLQLLEVDWGTIQQTSGKGTFKEEWILTWYPELTIKLLEKAPWGNTVEAAANKYLENAAAKCKQLDEITRLVSKALPADLHTGISFAMKRLDALAAATSDTPLLMGAFIPLVQVSRYGNVRKTDLETVNLIMNAVFFRILAGLPMSCTGIDDTQAQELAEKIKEVNQSLALLDKEELRIAWLDTISRIADMEQTAPVINGFCCKVLYDADYLSAAATANAFSKALSVNNAPLWSANWLEGFLKDAATVLILDDAIWDIVNGWMGTLEEETFKQVVPLLRRTFSVFTNVEKQKLAEKAKHGKAPLSRRNRQVEIDTERAQQMLPVLERLMGL